MWKSDCWIVSCINTLIVYKYAIVLEKRVSCFWYTSVCLLWLCHGTLHCRRVILQWIVTRCLNLQFLFGVYNILIVLEAYWAWVVTLVVATLICDCQALVVLGLQLKSRSLVRWHQAIWHVAGPTLSEATHMLLIHHWLILVDWKRRYWPLFNCVSTHVLVHKVSNLLVVSNWHLFCNCADV